MSGRFLRLFNAYAVAEIAAWRSSKGRRSTAPRSPSPMRHPHCCRGEESAKPALSQRSEDLSSRASSAGPAQKDVAEGPNRAGIAGIDAVTRAGFAASNGEARRMIKGAGAN